MTLLLSSVRNLAEAKSALAAGTDWLDLKEPKDGALGAVPGDEIARVVAWSKGAAIKAPISATIGDCWAQPNLIPQRVAQLALLGVDYIKIGLYIDNLAPALRDALQTLCQAHKIIIVCFVERSLNESVISDLLEAGACGLMLDTAEKTQGSLLAKQKLAVIGRFVRIVKEHDALCGLAGSLSAADIEHLVPLRPDYLGFRGALCANSRTETLLPQRVRDIKESLEAHNSADITYAVN